MGVVVIASHAYTVVVVVVLTLQQVFILVRRREFANIADDEKRTANSNRARGAALIQGSNTTLFIHLTDRLRGTGIFHPS